MFSRKAALAAGTLLLSLVASHASRAQTTPTQSGPWKYQDSGTKASLRGIHAVSDKIAWASGSAGTVLRTTDGGTQWQKCPTPDDSDHTDFRSIWAWDADRAIVVSAGPGYKSRVYKTTDACKTWTLTAYSPDLTGFWDGVVFFTENQGFILGDPVDGHWDIRVTQDGGKTWFAEGDPGLEADPKTEGAFAASNGAIFALGPNFWFASGGTGGAAIHYSTSDCNGQPNKGQCPIGWHKVAVPMAGGSAGAGVFSIAAAPHYGGPHALTIALVAVGGDYEKPNDTSGNVAFSEDGGVTWKPTKLPPHGYRSAVAYDQKAQVWICAGTNGSDVSSNGGATWAPLDDASWNALSLPWIVGPNGVIAKLAPGASLRGRP